MATLSTAPKVAVKRSYNREEPRFSKEALVKEGSRIVRTLWHIEESDLEEANALKQPMLDKGLHLAACSWLPTCMEY